jgi:hypothetical protein
MRQCYRSPARPKISEGRGYSGTTWLKAEPDGRLYM